MATCNSGAATTKNLPHSDQRLAGKVALVTGGASGIGESVVRLFRQHSANVCIVDLQDNLGHQLRDAMGGEPHVRYFHADVTLEDDMSGAVDFVLEKFGTLDVMVNNAGMTGPAVRDIRNVDLKDFQRVFDVNVNGAFTGMKHAARAMIPRGRGSIVSVASVVSTLGGLGPHAYTGSKHAVVGLTKSVAAELGNHGIRVNCVSPYAVATSLSMPHLPEGAKREDALEGFYEFVGRKANLKGVKLSADDVAQAVLYLASDEARYISGLNLLVDGGFSCVNHSFEVFT